MKRLLPVCFLLCLFPALARAHCFARYVSTPITPPQEFIWWFPVSLAIFIIGFFLIYWRVTARHWLKAIGLSCLTLLLFTIPFFLFGQKAASFSTAPPPGLNFPCPTFWGWEWQEAGWLFIKWNLYGFGFLLFALYLCGVIRRKASLLTKVIPLAFIIYTIGLIPYIATGAYLHGWGGGYYVAMGCSGRLVSLNDALVQYAKEHDGKLPTADNIKSLVNQLQPYFDPEILILYSTPIDVCPVADAYERQPQPYKWNANYSGKALKNIELETLYTKSMPVFCPCHPYISKRSASILLEYIEGNKGP